MRAVIELLWVNRWPCGEWVASDTAFAAEGWEVTQSSVSPDIAALRLVKVGGAYFQAFCWWETSTDCTASSSDGPIGRVYWRNGPAHPYLWG